MLNYRFLNLLESQRQRGLYYPLTRKREELNFKLNVIFSTESDFTKHKALLEKLLNAIDSSLEECELIFADINKLTINKTYFINLKFKEALFFSDTGSVSRVEVLSADSSDYLKTIVLMPSLAKLSTEPELKRNAWTCLQEVFTEN